MSWPNWPAAQAGLGAAAAAAPVAAAPATAMPAGMHYTPEQWAQMQQQNWQQWAQWQQQYQQWHQQYGAEYQKSLTAMSAANMQLPAMPTLTAPLPPTENPPLPPLPPSNLPTTFNPAPPPSQPNYNTRPPLPEASSANANAQASNFNTSASNQSFSSANPNFTSQGQNFNAQPPNYSTQPPPQTYKAAQVSYNTQAPPPSFNNAPSGYSTQQQTSSGFNNQYNSKNQQPPPGGYNTKQQAPPTGFPNQQQPPPNYNTQPPPTNLDPPRQNQNLNSRSNWQQSKRPFDRAGADFDSNKRQMRSRNDWNRPAQHPQTNNSGYGGGNDAQWRNNTNQTKPLSQKTFEEISEAEKKFDKEFAAWEEQFNKWKEQNANHPDKEQYKEYEKKWESWRNSLLERREQMRKKRLSLMGGAAQGGADAQKQLSTVVPTPKPLLATPTPSNSDNLDNDKNKSVKNPPLFEAPNAQEAPLGEKQVEPIEEKEKEEEENMFLKGKQDGGIPGLDLVKDNEEDNDQSNKEHEAEVIELEKEKVPPGPDFLAISKGINNILGDANLMNMLSKVAAATKTVNATNTPLVTEISAPFLQQQQQQNDYSNQSLEDRSNIDFQSHRESVNNFDDQTRSSFTMGPSDNFESAFAANNNNNNRNFAFNSNNNNFNDRRGGNQNQGGGFGRFNDRFSNRNFDMDQNRNNFRGNFDLPPNRNQNRNDFANNSNFNNRFEEPNFNRFDDDFDSRNNRFDSGNRFNNNDNFNARFDSANNDSFNRFDDGNNDYNRYQDDDQYYHDSRGGNRDFPQQQMSNNNNFNNDAFNYPNQCQNDGNVNAHDQVEEEDEIFEPSVVIDYDHKSKRPAEIDVSIEPLRMFDYRHKPLNRIPLPERPQWLLFTVRGIREFDLLGSRLPKYPPMTDFRRDKPPSVPPWTRGRSGRIMDSEAMEKMMNPGASHQFTFRRSQRSPVPENRFKIDKRPSEGDKEKVIDLSKDDDGDFEELSDGDDMDWNNDSNGSKRQQGDMQNLSSGLLNLPKLNQSKSVATKSNVISIDDLINPPGRFRRPPRIVIILRGPPGSGKTYLAKLIKDKEVENGGSAPRILSLDDYFMVEQEKIVIEDGKTVKVKEMVYEYEAGMEESYRMSLIKSFKKTITDGYFPFIIVDNVNDKVKYFGEMWSFAKQNGFQVYICQLDLDPQLCTKRNIHNRQEREIEDCIAGWEPTPSHHPVVDVSSLLQSTAIPDVEMEEVLSSDEEMERAAAEDKKQEDQEEDEEEAAEDQVRSKWDNFDCSINNLAKLDGVSKPLRPSQSMEEYLQLDDDWVTKPIKPGQKRVRWADLEEQKQQAKMRAIGFVVGQTNWNRMMDPTSGSSALTQTRFIERVKKY